MRKLMASFISVTLVITGLVAFNYKAGKPGNQLPEDDFTIDTLATGLTVPWSMVFIDKATLLFSERNGKLRLLRNDRLVARPMLSLEQIDTTRKMGLLGICLHPGFMNNKWVYISYDYNKDDRPYLRVVRYRFGNDTLLNPLVIIDHINGNANHSGCRLKFGPDAKLYITTGDADRPMLAQDLKSLNGKILRVNDDGTIPGDNPFANNDTARKEIWTYGHRNSQGIDFQASTGDLYNSEHGPTGGDEINLIQKGLNYGWPLVHHRDSRENMVSPLMEFTPSIAPCETVFYNGDAFPYLKGSLLVACLRGEEIMRLQLDKQKVVSREDLILHRYGRIRALTVSAEGYIYFSTSQNDPPEGRPKEGYDMILRMRPLKGATGLHNVSGTIQAPVYKSSGKKSTRDIYIELCAACHGANLEGTIKAKTFLNNQWVYGSAREDVIKNIREGIVLKGMPAWQGALSDKEIKSLADFVRKGGVTHKKTVP